VYREYVPEPAARLKQIRQNGKRLSTILVRKGEPQQPRIFVVTAILSDALLIGQRTPRRTGIRNWPSKQSGRCSKPSDRSSFPMPAGSTDSTRCRHRSRRPAWCALTTTNTRSRPVPSGGRSRFTPMPTHRDPPGRTHRCRACSFIRPRRYRLRSLALRAGAGSQTRCLAQRRSLQGPGASGCDRSCTAQARRCRRRQSADGRHPQRGSNRRSALRRGGLCRGDRPRRPFRRCRSQYPGPPA
jgi:hypothetical protein